MQTGRYLPFSFKKARTYLAAGKVLNKSKLQGTFFHYLPSSRVPSFTFKAEGKVPYPIIKVPSITFKNVLRYLVQSVVRYFLFSSIRLGGSLSNLKGTLKQVGWEVPCAANHKVPSITFEQRLGRYLSAQSV